MTRRTILAIDPSSTRTGYAAMMSPSVLLDLGWMAPVSRDDPFTKRTLAMVAQLLEVLGRLQPAVVIMEIPAQHSHRRIGPTGHGLAVYGFAAGAMYHQLHVWARHTGARFVEAVPEDWTGGVTKRARSRALAAEFREYAAVAKKDKGGDIADAIGMVQWYFDSEILSRATPV